MLTSVWPRISQNHAQSHYTHNIMQVQVVREAEEDEYKTTIGIYFRSLNRSETKITKI